MEVGAWLRWERDKRVYGQLFQKPTGVSTRANVSGARHYTEAEKENFEADSTDDAVLGFRGIEPGFEPLIGHHKLLWGELCAIARDNLAAHRQSARDCVGFGIRLGDFKKLGWATPLLWFEERLQELRQISASQKVWIFSDGSDEELKSLLVDPLVSRAPERRDLLGTFTLAKIAQMSGTKAMVVTGGSSFLRWGVFLGGVPVLAHAASSRRMMLLMLSSPSNRSALVTTMGITPCSRLYSMDLRT
jgi:hypothetical protein